jgi:hypothetical protein
MRTRQLLLMKFFLWTYTSPKFPMLQVSDDIDIFLPTMSWG